MPHLHARLAQGLGVGVECPVLPESGPVIEFAQRVPRCYRGWDRAAPGSQEALTEIPSFDQVENWNVDDRDKTAAILTGLRSELTDMLRDDGVKAFFRAHIGSWCRDLVQHGQSNSPLFGVGGPTPFRLDVCGPVVRALMVHGPRNLTEACVLLGALHDSGPHIGHVGRASPREWNTEAQAVSGEEDPRILDFTAHGMWHVVTDYLEMLTPEAIHGLPDWLETVNDDCRAARKDGAAEAEEGTAAAARSPVPEPETWRRAGLPQSLADLAEKLIERSGEPIDTYALSKDLNREPSRIMSDHRSGRWATWIKKYIGRDRKGLWWWRGKLPPDGEPS